MPTGANARFGMRGRIWALFIWQMAEGLVCLIMGLVTLSQTAPDFGGVENVVGYTKIGGYVEAQSTGWIKTSGSNEQWVALATYNGTRDDGLGPCTAPITQRIVACGSEQIEIKDAMRPCLDPRFDGVKKIIISQPPAPYGDGDNCVSNGGHLPTIIVLLFVFSLCVQMSEGLTYGIVPYVSRPALGVVSGMVGAGGNAGALLTNALFFTSDSLRTDLGLVYMGITILVVTCSLVFVYFPEHGSMLTKAGAIKCYDPQLIKPPEGAVAPPPPAPSPFSSARPIPLCLPLPRPPALPPLPHATRAALP